jgi:hypothetical protein
MSAECRIYFGFASALSDPRAEPGRQVIAGFEVRTSPQLRHWAPTVGLRIDDDLAFVTDTPYEASSSDLAEGVTQSAD